MKNRFKKKAKRYNQFKPQKMPKLTDSNWFPVHPINDIQIIAIRSIKEDNNKKGSKKQ